MVGSAIKIRINEQNCTGCLVCQLYCSYLQTHEFNPSRAFISINLQGIIPAISFLEGCKNCGQCAKHCVYEALELIEVGE